VIVRSMKGSSYLVVSGVMNSFLEYEIRVSARPLQPSVVFSLSFAARITLALGIKRIEASPSIQSSDADININLTSLHEDNILIAEGLTSYPTLVINMARTAPSRSGYIVWCIALVRTLIDVFDKLKDPEVVQSIDPRRCLNICDPVNISL
jgi:hypothetical protein